LGNGRNSKDLDCSDLTLHSSLRFFVPISLKYLRWYLNAIKLVDKLSLYMYKKIQKVFITTLLSQRVSHGISGGKKEQNTLIDKE
jgi:hypothetical protein